MSFPDNSAYIVEGEVSLIITAMSRSSKWPTYQQYNSHATPLVSALSQLRDVLRSRRSVRDMEPAVLLQPFLDVIRSDFTTGPITSLALISVTKFVKYGFFNLPDAEGATTVPAVNTDRRRAVALAMENIVSSATHARFVGTEPSSDEVVLMRILELMRVVLTSSSGRLLSNESVCELLQACFRVCFETRLSELLRKVAEDCLIDMTRTIFCRIREFREAFDPSQTQTVNNSNSASSTTKTSQLSRRSRLPISMTETKAMELPAEKDYVDTVDSPQQESSTATSVDNDVDTSSTSIVNDQSDLGKVTEDSACAPSDSTQPLAQPDCNSDLGLPSATSQSSVSIANREEFELVEKRDLLTSDESTAAAAAARLYVLGTVENSASGAHQREQLSRSASVVDQQNVCTTNRTSSCGIVGNDWGLPAACELLRFVTSITNPAERQNSDTMISCGLQLLAVAIESAGSSLRVHQSLLRIVQYQTVRHLVRLLVRPATQLSQYAAALRCCFLLIEALRDVLRWPLEFLFRKLLDIVAGGEVTLLLSSSTTNVNSAATASAAPWSNDHRELALETLGAIWRLPGLLTELYVNYDCTPHCFDVVESAVQLLARLACPSSGAVSSVHLLSLDVLLTLVDVLEQSCCVRALACNDSSSISTSNSNPLVESGSLCIDAATVPTSTLSSSDLSARKRRKLLHQLGIDQFNSKPAKGIEFLLENGVLHSPLDAAELASFLRENSGVDKRVLGDFLSTKQNANILRSFVRSFAFANVPIEESLRVYLETFRLPGEAVPIQYVLEQFAEWWHEANGSPFDSVDAAFTLAYSVIMLNTDQHNPNSRRQNVPMKCEDFKRNLRGVNGGRNFDDVLLERIYESIHNEEIVLPDEQSGLLRESFEWKLIRRKIDADEACLTAPATASFTSGAVGPYIRRVANGACDQEVFALSWSRIVSALCFVMDKCSDETIISRAIGGFRQCASIAAHLAMSDVVDKLVISLCKFGGLLSPNLTQPVAVDQEASLADAIAQQLVGSFKGQLVMRTVFQLVHRHGDFVRDGWRNVLDCLVQLYRAQLLPEVFVHVEDFMSPVGHVSLVDVRRAALNRVAQAAQAAASSGVVSSLLAYFTSSNSTTSSVDSLNSLSPSAAEAETMRRAQDCVIEFHLEQLTQDCKFFRTDSLQELLKALAIGATNGSCTHDTPILATSLLNENEASLSGHVFFLELLVRVVLQNRDRIAPLWPICRRYFAHVLTEARQPTFLIERAAVGLVRIAIRLLRREDVSNDVLHSLNLLLLMRPALFCAISPQLAAGLYDLVQTNPANIRDMQAWRTISTLLQTIGTGLALPERHRRSLIASFVELAPAVPAAASPAAIAAASVSTFTEQDHEPRNWTILPELSFQSHELRSLVRSCETLSFIVHAPANLVTLDNFPLLVQTIRIFIEATINLADSRPQSSRGTSSLSLLGSTAVTRGTVVNLRQATIERHEELSKVKAKNKAPVKTLQEDSSKRNSKHRKDENVTAAAQAQSVVTPVPSDDDEAGFDDAYKSISVSDLFRKISYEMLDLLFTLHTHALAIYMTKCNGNGDADSVAQKQLSSSDVRCIWFECWCPVLSAIARLCCDQMRAVRGRALTCLQSCLLRPELWTVAPIGWSSFRVILFPLLECLLSNNIAPQDVSGLGETRARLAALVCKVFLQHLQLLARRTDVFLDLWFTVLDYLQQYYVLLEQHDWHADAIPESLKNLLLVIETTKVFQTASLQCSTEDEEKPLDDCVCKYTAQVLGIQGENESTAPLCNLLWELTWQRIDKFLPQLRNEMLLSTMIHQQQSGTKVLTSPTTTRDSNCEDLSCVESIEKTCAQLEPTVDNTLSAATSSHTASRSVVHDV